MQRLTDEITDGVHRALAKIGADIRQVVAFDLDGTLVVDTGRGRPAGVLPAVRGEVAAVAARLLDEGHRLLIVTGRETEDEARRDTLRALAHVRGAPPDGAALGRLIVAAGGRWSGNRTAITRKVAALKEHGAVVLVGDLAHLDGVAARMVGIPFVRVPMP